MISNSLLKILDSQYESLGRNIIHEVSNDRQHISSGTDDVNPLDTINIFIDDENCIHYLNRYMICGYYIPINQNQFIESAVSLFEGISIQIGNIKSFLTNSSQYQAQKLSKMGRSQLDKISKGLMMTFQDFNYNVTENTTIQPNMIQDYVQSIILNQKQYLQNGKYPFAIPLTLIFPQLYQLKDNAALYTNQQSKIQLTMKVNPANICQLGNFIVPLVVEPPFTVEKVGTYSITNLTLLRCYSKLDINHNDTILKSQVIFPRLQYVHYQIPNIQQNMNLIFQVSPKDKIRGLIFGFHCNLSSYFIDQQFLIDDTFVNISGDEATAHASEMPYKYSLGLFPQLPIQQLQININGKPIVINLRTMQLLHLTNSLGDQEETYTNPLQRAFKWAYFIDLTKYGYNDDRSGRQVDQSGSSTEINQVTVQMQLKIDDENQTLPFQGQPWDLDNLSQFSLYSYLEIQTMIELKNGKYYEL